MTLHETLASLVADVPDFPKPGIIFKDITPLLQDGEAFRALAEHLAERYRDAGVTQIVAVESRGFIFGAALGAQMETGVTLVRKPGKLPRAIRSQTYELEYGTDELQIHADALSADDRVVIVDDVLATGGTAAATAKLVESCGAEIVEIAFLMELGFLEGRAKLGGRPIYSLLTY